MTIKIDNSFQFRGKDVFGNSHEQLLTLLKKSLLETKETLLVFTPNPEQVMLAESDSSFDAILKRADILVPDGIGLTIASKLLSSKKRGKITQRIPGRILVEDIIKLGKQHKKKILLIGGKDYSHTGTITVNNLEIFWTQGYRDAFNPTNGEEVELQQKIEEVKPDIIFVAFGAPMQEKWLVQHRELLNKENVSIGMVVGGSFDYLLGLVPLPPSWVSKIGFEWLFRLMTQPWRYKRQTKLISFILLVLKEKIGLSK